MAFRGLIGDAVSRPDLYAVPIRTEAEAAALIKLLYGTNGRTLPMGYVNVTFTGKSTRWVHGRCIPQPRPFYFEIRLNRIGENVGTLLHELGHLAQLGHGPKYKYAHLKLVEAYDDAMGRINRLLGRDQKGGEEWQGNGGKGWTTR